MIHLIENLKDRFSIRDLCKLFEVARSTIYDRRERSNKTDYKDHKFSETIIETCLDEKAYGYRRITEMVKTKGFEVDKKKVYAIMKKLGLLRKNRKKWIQTTDSNHSNQYSQILHTSCKLAIQTSYGLEILLLYRSASESLSMLR